MTEKHLTSVPPDPGTGQDFGALVTEQVHTRPPRTARRVSREPQMRALRRILGDQVLDIFPQGLMDSVEGGYKFWETHVDSYIVTAFESEQDRDDALAVMRAYAECAGEDGYTIATQNVGEKHELTWRTQKRRGSATTDDN
jgi:hypothetical protein